MHLKIVIEAKRPDYDDWRTRQHLGDENFLYRANKISLEMLLLIADKAIVRWIAIEPLTEYRVGVYDYTEPRGLALERTSPEAYVRAAIEHESCSEGARVSTKRGRAGGAYPSTGKRRPGGADQRAKRRPASRTGAWA